MRYLLVVQGLSNNTVGKYIKTLKTFLHYAVDKGWYTDSSFSKKFKVFREEADTISLTDEELKSLYDLDLSNNKRLENVRDTFLLQCYTSL